MSSSSSSVSDDAKSNANRDRSKANKSNVPSTAEGIDSGSGLTPISNYYNDFFENL